MGRQRTSNRVDGVDTRQATQRHKWRKRRQTKRYNVSLRALSWYETIVWFAIHADTLCSSAAIFISSVSCTCIVGQSRLRPTQGRNLSVDISVFTLLKIEPNTRNRLSQTNRGLGDRINLNVNTFQFNFSVRIRRKIRMALRWQ